MTANRWKLTGNKTKSSQFCAMTKLSKMHYQEKHVDAIRASSYVRHLGGMFDNHPKEDIHIKHVLKNVSLTSYVSEQFALFLNANKALV